MDRIVVTGAEHPLAWRLGAYLLDRGHSVVAVTERPEGELPPLPWDVRPRTENTPWESGWFEGARAVFHFGSPEAVADAEGLVAALARSKGSPLALVAVSTLDVFGTGNESAVDESAGVVNGSAARYERALRELPHGRGRVVLARLAPRVRWIGGVVGASWVQEDDAVRLLIHAMETPSLEGALNVVAPETRASDGVKARPGRALATGFKFRYPTYAEAVAKTAEIRTDWADLDVVERVYWVAETPDRMRFFPGSIGRYRISLKGIPLAWETRRERISGDVDGEELSRGAFQTFQRRQRVTPLGQGSLVEDAVAFRVRGGALLGRWIHQAVQERLFAALDSADSLGDPSSFESQLQSDIEAPLSV